MRGHLSALMFACGLFALTSLAPVTASADVHLTFGTKWDPLRYTTAAFPCAGGCTNVNPGALKPLLGNSGFQTTSLDPYVGVFFAQKYGVLLSLDIGYGKLSQDTTTGTVMGSNNSSFFQFGFALGYKMYFNQPKKERISPYLYVDFFKYFASVSTDTPGTDPGVIGAAGALLSPIGATFAFGAEYFVTPGFSLGSEIFGLKVADVGTDYTTGMGATKTGVSYTYVTFYTGITLNYRFQIQTSVNVSEETEGDEEAAVKPKKKKVKPVPASDDDNATPPVPPPPSPEAVD